MFIENEINSFITTKESCIVKEANLVCNNIKKGRFEIDVQKTSFFQTASYFLTSECSSEDVKNLLVDVLQDLCSNCSDVSTSVLPSSIVTPPLCGDGALTDESGNFILDENNNCIYPEESTPEGTLTVNYLTGFEATSGTPPVDSNVYVEGDTYIIKDNTGNLTCPGKTFVGWDRNATVNNTQIPDYFPNNSIIISNNSLIFGTKTQLNLVPKFI